MVYVPLCEVAHTHCHIQEDDHYGGERVYKPLYKVADTPFHIHSDHPSIQPAKRYYSRFYSVPLKKIFSEFNHCRPMLFGTKRAFKHKDL